MSGPYIPYGLFQPKGEKCAKFGPDRFRNANLYKFHTNVHFIYIVYTYTLYIYIYIHTHTHTHTGKRKAEVYL